MVKDKPETSLVRHVLYTCGKKAAVVKMAATNPKISMKLILPNNIHDFTRYDDHFFGCTAFQLRFSFIMSHD